MKWKKVLLPLFLILGGLYFVYLEVFHIQDVQISDKDRELVRMMPLPAELAIHSGKLDVTSHLQIVLRGYSDAELEKTVSWYKQ